ncbi:MAG: winged helix-turn-helix domain-containing protein [Acidimicrobiales bacterium]
MAGPEADHVHGGVCSSSRRRAALDGRVGTESGNTDRHRCIEPRAGKTGSPRQVFSRAQLLEHVWASRTDWQDEATVTEHVRRLRRKVEKDPDRPLWIVAVLGVGYRFEP